MHSVRRRLLCGFVPALALALAGAPAAHAQADWPTHPLTLIVPFSAGFPLTFSGSRPLTPPVAFTCAASSAIVASNDSCGMVAPMIVVSVSAPLAVRSIVCGVVPCPLATTCALIVLALITTVAGPRKRSLVPSISELSNISRAEAL